MDLELRFEPEYRPDAIDCMQLSASVKMPGFAVEQRIMKSVVDEFLVEARNADTTSAIECQEKIRRAQISAQIFQNMVDRVNSYVTAYTLAESATTGAVMPDPTEGTVDLGEYSTELDGVENLFDLEGGL